MVLESERSFHASGNLVVFLFCLFVVVFLGGGGGEGMCIHFFLFGWEGEAREDSSSLTPLCVYYLHIMSLLLSLSFHV